MNGKYEGNENPDDGIIDTMKKRNLIEASMQILTRKIFQLELCEEMAVETEVKLAQKEQEVAREKRKLDELYFEKISKMENFCDEVWRFSSSNDFYSILNEYLDTPKREEEKFASEPDVRLEPEVSRIEKEKTEAEERLAKMKIIRQNLEENLRRAEVDLQIAESYGENDPEIISLKRSTATLRESTEALEKKITMIKGLIFENNVRSRRDDDRTIEHDKYPFVTASELLKKSKNKKGDTRKRGKFSVKRESAISRKLARVSYQ